MSYKIIIEEEEGGRYSTSCPGLYGCYSWGYTEEEAIKILKK